LPGDAQMLPHRLIRAWNGGHARDIEAFSLTTQLARARRFARGNGDPRSLLSTLGHAYHFDAGRYAAFLRQMAEGRGVRRYEGRVARIERDGETGLVRALTTERGERIAADLFIDCSGLKGLLIEGEMAAGFEDWSHWLPCDSAWAAPTAADPAAPLHTTATAAQAGWRWRIPLQHRVGNGYVFSSRFQQAEAARDSLLAAIGTPEAEPRLIRFVPGRRRKAWIGNVVAIGLSSGFLEPLESTSIHLIQTGIGKLLSLFPRQDCAPLLAEQYNRVFAREMEDVRDFLVLHYHFTQGRTEPLWQACQAAPLPDSLAYKVEQFRASGRLMLQGEDLFRDASWFAVMTGQGLRAADHNPMLDSMSEADNLRHLDAVQAAIAKSAAQLQAAGHEPAHAVARAGLGLVALATMGQSLPRRRKCCSGRCSKRCRRRGSIPTARPLPMPPRARRPTPSWRPGAPSGRKGPTRCAPLSSGISWCPRNPAPSPACASTSPRCGRN
jgi:tryptophan halogenase